MAMAVTYGTGTVVIRRSHHIACLAAYLKRATDRGLMKKKAQDRTSSTDNWKELFKPLPFGRGATAEEIGAAIAFLASAHSGYTSGSIVTIDAGLSARASAF